MVRKTMRNYENIFLLPHKEPLIFGVHLQGLGEQLFALPLTIY